MKCLGNKEGPHVLAAELVGTQAAAWLGLATFDYAILPISEGDEIPIAEGKLASLGPAFATKAERGHTWGGDAAELKDLANVADISRMVVFDTWTRNCDRHPPDSSRRPNMDNVFVSFSRPAPTLIAMDHSHCFTCGRELTAKLAGIATVKDKKIYGLFPAFRDLISEEDVMASCETLKGLTPALAGEWVSVVPAEWEVSTEARAALVDFLVGRAAFVAENIVGVMKPICWPAQTEEL